MDMAILICKMPVRLLTGIFLLLSMNACRNDRADIRHIFVDSISCSFDGASLYNNCRAVYGFTTLHMGNNIYMCCMEDDSTILKCDILGNKKTDTIAITGGHVRSLGSTDSTLYLVCNYRNLHQIHFKADSPVIVERSVTLLPSLFNDSLFISAGTGTNLIPLTDNKLLIPFGAINETLSYLDTNAYIMTSVGDSGSYTAIVRHPPEFLTTYEYFTASISDYNKTNNCLYYTFNKKEYLYRLNIHTRRLDSVLLKGFTKTAFDQDKMQSFTYIRSYIYQNDKNCKIICDNDKVFLIVRDHNKQYVINAFSSDLKLLSSTKINNDIFPEMAFIKDHQLYAPLHDHRLLRVIITDNRM